MYLVWIILPRLVIFGIGGGDKAQRIRQRMVRREKRERARI
jgi:hypothetical protein